jgi:glutathione S-transferase
VPVLVEDNGLVIPDSSVICEYLEEAYPDTALLGHTLAERVEIRRLVAWFDGKFAQEVSRNLLGEKFLKRLFGRGQPDVAMIRAGYANLRSHLEYIGWLAEQPRWQRALAGGFCRRGASLGAGFCRRGGLVRLHAGAGLVRAHEIPAVLPAAADRPRGRHRSAATLPRSRFLANRMPFRPRSCKTMHPSRHARSGGAGRAA